MTTTARSRNTPHTHVTNNPLERFPPNDPEAERALLASMLITPDCIEPCMALISNNIDALFTESHRLLLTAIIDLWASGRPIDSVNLLDLIRTRRQVELITHPDQTIEEYIYQLVSNIPSAANAESYAQVIADKALRRGLISTCASGLREAHDAEQARQTIDEMQQQLGQLLTQGGPVQMGQLVGSVLPTVIENLTGDPTVERTGIPTGLDSLDNIIGGLKRRNLIGIGAHTKHGKSALAVQFALNAALRNNTPAAIFSFEMTEAEIVERMLLAESRMSRAEYRRGLGTPTQQHRFAAAEMALRECRIVIDTSCNNTVPAIRSRVRSYQRQYGIGLLIVDYYQLLDADTGGTYERRYERLVDVSRQLKLLANDLDIPVVVPCQLNADAEKEDRLPRPNDVEECKKFPKDCNVFMVLDREWQRKRHDTSWCQNNADKQYLATVDVPAARSAASATTTLHWQPAIVRFFDPNQTTTETTNPQGDLL